LLYNIFVSVFIRNTQKEVAYVGYSPAQQAKKTQLLETPVSLEKKAECSPAEVRRRKTTMLNWPIGSVRRTAPTDLGAVFSFH